MIHLEERRANAQAVPPIIHRAEVRADTWAVGIQKVREAIDKTITPVMQTIKLWYETPQGDNLDAWVSDIKKQTERIDWNDYDTICFQTTDSKWRQKILSERLTLQQAIDYGRTSIHTRAKTKKLEDVANGKAQEESLGRVGNAKSSSSACKKCGFDSHMSGKCPAAGKECYRSGAKDHFGHAPACSGKKKKKKKEKTKRADGSSKSKGEKSKKKDDETTPKRRRKSRRSGKRLYMLHYPTQGR